MKINNRRKLIIDPELFDEVLSGKKSIHAGYTELKAKFNDEQQSNSESEYNEKK